MIQVTPSDFRAAFPEFKDVDVYPDALLEIWLDFGIGLVNEKRWGRNAKLGAMLVAAHYLTMGQLDQAAGQNGGAVGGITGPVASKSVDKVSVSYQSNPALIDGAGSWNSTSYGIRYLTLARLFGAGGIQL